VQLTHKRVRLEKLNEHWGIQSFPTAGATPIPHNIRNGLVTISCMVKPYGAAFFDGDDSDDHHKEDLSLQHSFSDTHGC